MSPNSLTSAAVPWLVAAWIVTVVVVALLIYLIMRAVLGKTDPERLPEVLSELTPLLRGIAQALARPFLSPSASGTTRLSTPRGKEDGDRADGNQHDNSPVPVTERELSVDGTNIGQTRDNAATTTGKEL